VKGNGGARGIARDHGNLTAVQSEKKKKNKGEGREKSHNKVDCEGEKKPNGTVILGALLSLNDLHVGPERRKREDEGFQTRTLI